MKLTKLARILDSKMLLLSSIQELYFISHDMCIITIGSILGFFFFLALNLAGYGVVVTLIQSS